MPGVLRKNRGRQDRRPRFHLSTPYRGGLKVKFWFKTRGQEFENVVQGWYTLIVAPVHAMSVIVAVQLLLGQPPCLPVGCAGAAVSTSKPTFPLSTCAC